ncbi:MAG: ComEA family DNA-binding protein [Chloroflexi bacterium]|nr:ComEA family DNA-binding protein [Chloroflexota bacterium]
MKNTLYVLLGVMAGFILSGVLIFVSRAPAGNAILLQPAPTETPIAIDVTGAVARPGLYKFPTGARVQDAIDAAGGLLAEADTASLNLAALLEDAQQLDIPYASGSEPQTTDPLFQLPTSVTETPTPDPNIELVNINTATVEELDALPGIGPTTAQNIIDYRDANGPFATIESIMDVPGIGPSTFDEIQFLITVD